MEEFLEDWHAGNGILVRTSGSTGIPKEIRISHDQIRRSARRTINFFKLSKKSRIHSAISFEYIGGKMMIARSLLSGCLLSFNEPSLYPEIENNGQDIDLCSVVAAQMPHIIDNKKCFGHIRAFLIGGSAIDNRLWDKIVNSGLPAWESYGMTETASHIALRRIAGKCSQRPRFVPLPGIKVNVDSEGRLLIKDNNVLFPANDIAKIYNDGSFEILGRKDNIIITGGIKVNLLDLEDKLRTHLEPVCSQFFLTTLPDEIWTSKIVLVGITSEKKDWEKLKDKISRIINELPESEISKKMHPKEIRMLSSLPLTPSGKLLRRIDE